MGQPTRLLVSDIDGTLLEDGRSTPGLETLRALVDAHRPDIHLVYATGRTMASIRELVEMDVLPRPDAVAANVGTELWFAPFAEPDRRYHDHIAEGYRRDRILDAAASFPEIRPQEAGAQSDVKASFYLEDPDVVPRFEQLLERAEAGARVIYSCDRFLDALPRRAGKRNAVEHLRRRLGIRPARVLVAGDSGNDIDMLADPTFLAVAVGNAGEELAEIGARPSEHQSQLPHAAGVLEGAEVFEFWT